MKTFRGFTLIELMIAVAIVAILAGIAIPGYSNYVNRGKIKTAQSDLVSLGLNYENYYQRKLSYPSTSFADLAALKAQFKSWSPASAALDFSFQSLNASGSSYELVATGASGKLSGCVITLKSNGDKTISSCSLGNGGWL